MRPAIVLSMANALILLVYLVLERSLPTTSPRCARAMTVAIIGVIVVSAAATRWRSRRWADLIVNVQLSLLACLIALLAMEGLFLAAPEIFPENLRRLVDTRVISEATREGVVEKLLHPPYAKLRANATIHIPGYYGPKEAFEYQWRTDFRGFKNLESVAALGRFEVVAVGDSFTEGMGVRTEDVWTSQISRLGHPAYSIGVQGYGPTQFAGAYEHYGRRLPTGLVVVGYTADIYLREAHFQKEIAHTLSGQELPSAIGRLVERDELEAQQPIHLETKEGYRVPIVGTVRHTFVTSAIIALALQELDFYWNFDIQNGTLPGDPRFMAAEALQGTSDFKLGLMARYRGEMLGVGDRNLDPVELATDPLWSSTEREFERIIRMARDEGAKVVFIFFPSRATAYFEQATGRTLPANSGELVQAALLEQFARSHGTDVIDMTPVFRRYVATLTPESPIEFYPYLPVDGHPSIKGHELIAAEVARYLEKRRY